MPGRDILYFHDAVSASSLWGSRARYEVGGRIAGLLQPASDQGARVSSIVKIDAVNGIGLKIIQLCKLESQASVCNPAAEPRYLLV